MGLAELREQQKQLERQEAKTVPGAFSREPKQHLLDASDVQKRHPDKHIRWVNIKDPQKVESRQLEGYVRLTAEEGGRQVGGELALFAIPKAQYESRVAWQRQRNRELLTAHRGEMQKEAQKLERELRDQHGFDVGSKGILVDESAQTGQPE